MPRFESISAGFGMKLPRSTMMLVDVMRSGGPIVLMLAAVVMLAWAGSRLWETFYPSAMWSIWRTARDRALWSLPLAHGVVRDRGLAEAFDLMADGLRGGASVERAMEEAAKLRVNDVLRRRLEHWAEQLTSGVTLHEGAKAARMPSLVVEMLGTLRGPETADVLAFLARHYATRYSRGAALLSAAAMPAMVLVFAALVAWVALALMTPMASLIEHLSTKTWQI